MTIRKRLAVAAVLTLLTACSDKEDRPPSSGDGGVTEPDAGSATVRGSGQWHHIDPSSGIALAPRDLSGSPIAALLPDEAGTSYTVRPGTLDASNTAFTIENVTLPYLLRFGTSYAWMTGRTEGAFTPDVSLPKFARRDAVTAGAGTGLALNVTGLSSWQPSQDSLQLAAPYAGLVYFSLDCGAAYVEPASGATSTSVSLDWEKDPARCANPSLLIDASKGDSLYVNQLVGRYDSSFLLVINELKRSYTPTAFSLKDGQSVTLEAPLAALPTTSRTFDMRYTAFRDVSVAAHPTAAASYVDFGLGALPGLAALGESTGYPDLATCTTLLKSVADQTITFDYANPFPADWGTHLAVRTTALTSFSVPLPSGGDAPALLVGSGVSLALELPATQTGALTVQPVVGPARALSLNGQVATGAPLVGVGTTPLVSWQAPELGTADFYRVFVHELSVSNTTGKTKSTLVADFFTESTSLRIPADILASGKHYYLRVLTTKSSRWSPVKPFLTQYGEGTATALSSRFTP